jgi:hypothetical protein
MVEFLRDERGEARRKSGRRKLRLFACACLRGIWEVLRRPGSRTALYVAECVADGLKDARELARAHQAARGARLLEPYVAGSPYRQAAEAAVQVSAPRFGSGNYASVAHVPLAAAIAWAMYQAGAREDPDRARFVAARRSRVKLHADWLRDVFGNPFRPVTCKPAWRTPEARRLAKVAYEDRAFDRLPVLADVLEEAGCADAQLLVHLRGPDAHVRGCWALDLVRSVD